MFAAGCDDDPVAGGADDGEQFPVLLVCDSAMGDVTFLRGMTSLVPNLGEALAGLPEAVSQCGTEVDRDAGDAGYDIACTSDLDICRSLRFDGPFGGCYPEQTAQILEISRARFANAFDEYEDLVLCAVLDSPSTTLGNDAASAGEPTSTAIPDPTPTATAAPTSTPTPEATRRPLPADAILDERFPDDWFGLTVDGGALTLIVDETDSQCSFQTVAGVRWDPAAVAYSYTQSFRGLTESFTFTPAGEILEGDWAESRPGRHQGSVWPSGAPGNDFIGFGSFEDGGFVLSTTLSGDADACGQASLRDIELDQIVVTNLVAWFSRSAPPPTPIPTPTPTGDLVDEDRSRSLVTWAEEFWANPPVEVEVINLTYNDDVLEINMLGPVIDGRRLAMSRAPGMPISLIGIASADYDPTQLCVGGCGWPSTVIDFMFSPLTIEEFFIDQGLVTGELGQETLMFIPYTGPDCFECRTATTGDLETFWDFIDQTLATQ